MMDNKKFEADLHDAMAALNNANKRIKQTLKNLRHVNWPQRPNTPEVQLKTRLNLKNAVDHSDAAADAVLQTLILAAGFFGIVFGGKKKEEK
jgi:hypothetical protein